MLMMVLRSSSGTYLARSVIIDGQNIPGKQTTPQWKSDQEAVGRTFNGGMLHDLNKKINLSAPP
jgi:hypothetical protein